MAKEAAPNTIYLKDYEPPAWRTEETHLEVDIRDGVTQVSSRLLVRRDPEAEGGAEAAPHREPAAGVREEAPLAGKRR